MKRSNQFVAPMQWWKNIKNIIGKSNHEFMLSNPHSNVPLNSKETANLMSEYFTSLTSNCSEVRDSLLDVGQKKSDQYYC